jgi:hypothetical protein
MVLLIRNKVCLVNKDQFLPLRKGIGAPNSSRNLDDLDDAIACLTA